jgi:TRAP-type C4-dicarboxylate transport system permease small subunit
VIRRILVVLSSLAVAGLILNVTIDVALRQLVGRPLPGTLALVESWWLPLIVGGGLLAARDRAEHIETDALLAWASAHAKCLALHLRRLMLALILGFLAATAVSGAWIATQRGQRALTHDIPVWPPRWAVAAGLGTWAVVAASEAFARTRRSVPSPEAGPGTTDQVPPESAPQ